MQRYARELPRDRRTVLACEAQKGYCARNHLGTIKLRADYFTKWSSILSSAISVWGRWTGSYNYKRSPGMQANFVSLINERWHPQSAAVNQEAFKRLANDAGNAMSVILCNLNEGQHSNTDLSRHLQQLLKYIFNATSMLSLADILPGRYILLKN